MRQTGSEAWHGDAVDAAYPLEATPTLNPPAWQPLGSATADIDGSFQFLDSGVSNHLVRFSRSVEP